MVFSIILLVCAFGLTKLKVTYSTYDLIEPTFDSYKLTQELQQDYNDKNVIILYLKKEVHAADDSDLCQIQTWFNDHVLIHPNVQVIWNPFSIRQAVVDIHNDSKKIWFPKVTAIDCSEQQSNARFFAKVESLAIPNKDFFFGPKNDSIMFVIKVNSNAVAFYENLSKSFQQFKTQQSSPWTSYWMGEAVYEHYVIKGNNSTGLVNTLAIFIIFLVLFIYFKNLKVFAVFLIVLLSALIIVHGIMGWLNHKLDLLSLGIFLMLMIAIIEDFYFVIMELRFSEFAFEKLALPSLLTSLTTFVGFATLSFSDLFIIRKFGAYVAFGALLEWGILFLILPSFLALFPNLRFSEKKQVIDSGKFIKAIQNFSISKKAALIIIAFIPTGFLFLEKMNINASPASLYSSIHPINVSRDAFVEDLKYDFEASLIFHPKTSDVEKRKINLYMRSYPSISRIESFDQHSDFILKNVPEEDKFGLSLDLQETELSRRYQAGYRNQREILHLTRSDFNFLNQLIKDVELQCAGKCQIGGVLISFAELGAKILKSLAESVYISAVIVFLIIFMYAASLNFSYIQSAIISMCSLFGPSMTLFCLWIFNQEMNLATSICFAALIGIAGDNVIQLIAKPNEQNSIKVIQEKFMTSFLITITMALLCLSFGLSDFKALQQLGYWMSLGFVFGFVGDYYLLKSYLQKSSIK